MKDKLAEEIIEKKLKGAVSYGAKDGTDGRQLVIKAMQVYHEAKIEEITDADIEEWAFRNYPDSYNMRKSCKAGAKAMREGEINHIEK